MVLLYIDPGAGSLVIQALIAAVVSVPFFFRNTIRSAWHKVRRSDPSPGEDHAAES